MLRHTVWHFKLMLKEKGMVIFNIPDRAAGEDLYYVPQTYDYPQEYHHTHWVADKRSFFGA